MKQNIRELTRLCIHFIGSQCGERIPTSLADARHGSKPNEEVNADFLYGRAANGCNVIFILVIKDDLSSYAWLHSCDYADNDAATTATKKWIPGVGCINGW